MGKRRRWAIFSSLLLQFRVGDGRSAFKNPLGLGHLLFGYTLAEPLHLLHDLFETEPFGCADPLELKPVCPQPHLLHLLLHPLDAALGPVVGIQVVAIADMTAGDQPGVFQAGWWRYPRR